MNVFVAGSTGDVGRPVVRALVAGGHEVTGMTHRRERRALIESLGARPALAHAFDAGSVRRVVSEARPEAVIDVMTALPRRGPLWVRDLEATNQIRKRGSAILLEAARAAGARRVLSESIVYAFGWAEQPHRLLTEEDPLYRARIPAVRPAIEAMRAKEQGTLRAGGLEGIVLRFGAFYGPDVGTTQTQIRLARRRLLGLPGGGQGVVSWIHVDDAATATVAALERAEAGETYNVVDDEPVTFRRFAEELCGALWLPRPYNVPETLVRLIMPYAALIIARARVPASNRKAREALGWVPAFPTYREGLADVAARLRGRRSGRGLPS